MAQLNGRMLCIKHILVILNFLFVLIGVLLITIGTSLLLIYYDFDTFLESHHFKPAESIIAAGIIIFLVSFFGCIGAVKESTILIKVYTLFLLFVLVVEIFAGSAAFLLRYSIYNDIKWNMMNALNVYTKLDRATNSWDFTQNNLHCCGVERPSDWEPLHVQGHSVEMQGLTFTVPNSCCYKHPRFCYGIYKRGCLNVLEGYVSQSSLVLGYTAVTVVIIQVLGIFIAHRLAKAIRYVKTEEEMERLMSNYRISEPLYDISEESLERELHSPSPTLVDA